MSTNNGKIIQLIKSAITGEKYDFLGQLDFSEILSFARKHKIVPLIYHGLVNCGFFDEAKNLMQEVLFYIQINEFQKLFLKEINKAFDNSQIKYMHLKGIVLKDLYPMSEMRCMGDIDILINNEQYEQIKPIMIGLGFSEIRESDHEYKWSKNNIIVELHKQLFSAHNKDFYSYFGDGWRFGKLHDGMRYYMTDEDSFIYLFTHFARHYRDAGIGIKHILDLWVFRKSKPNLNEEYIKKELSALKLYDFYINVLKTLDVWFGTGESDHKTDIITHTIFNSGVYGRMDSSITSQGLRMSKKVSNVKAVKTLKLMFPSYKSMCVKYRILRKIPILLPIFWIYRVFNILFDPTSIKKYNMIILFSNKRRIFSYRRALNEVGLDFNFK